jgi:hypothetical protein
MRTTVQVSDGLRRRLKVLASSQDISYEQALEAMAGVYQAAIPFSSKREFADFFEGNLGLFGFARVLERRPKGYPDYRVADAEGRELEVVLELVGESFRHRGRDPAAVERIVCVFCGRKRVEGVKVVSLIELPERKGDFMRYRGGGGASVSIPEELAEKSKQLIKGTGFSDLSEYLTYILREIVSNKSGWDNAKTRQDKELVIEKLRSLGYL